THTPQRMHTVLLLLGCATLALSQRCPDGYKLLGDGRCLWDASAISCPYSMANGPCNEGNICPTEGYACDVTHGHCCAVVDKTNMMGPAIDGMCHSDYVPAVSPYNEDVCVLPKADAGVCSAYLQTGPCDATMPCMPGSTCATLAGVCCFDYFFFFTPALTNSTCNN
ncbi:hypothetical protein PFISCL1PPCAC_3604, partial [Pristionchus fissidentatus]